MKGLARALLYLVFGVLALVALYPLLWLALNSLKTEVQMFQNTWSLPTELHWEHYTRAWQYGIAKYFLNSVLVTAVSVFLVVLISTMAAYALSRFRFRGQTLFLFLILGGLMLAPGVSLIPLFRILVKLKLYNTYFAMILPDVAFGIPFTTFLLRGFLLELPRDFEEAANIDGAGPVGVFRHIIVPLCRPIVASVTVLEAMRVWNEFMFAQTFIESDKLRTLPVGITAFSSALRTEWTSIMAGLVIAALPMVLLFVLAQRHLVRGLTAGGVKG